MSTWNTGLADALKRRGINVVEVGGWKTRGHGAMLDVRGVLWHHTVGAASGNLPSLNVLRGGRPGLEGPLCNLALARDGSVYVVAGGRAYHAGAADSPGKWPWAGGNSNSVLIGIEMESVGNGKDWTAEQKATIPRLAKALAEIYDLPSSRQLGHKEWAPSRKIDPAGIDMAWIRSSAASSTSSATTGGSGGGAGHPGMTKPLPVAISRPLLQQGQRSAAVKQLQSDLNQRGIGTRDKSGRWIGTVQDGDFGPATARAVAAFQLREGLDDDGVVGPKTWAKLLAISPTYHYVVKGESWNAVAKTYSLTLDGLRLLNGPLGTLAVGQLVKVKK